MVISDINLLSWIVSRYVCAGSFSEFTSWTGYFTKDKGDLCIAMEYIPFGDLHSYLQDRPPLGESDAQQVIIQILQGLAVVHKAVFTHRDIRPQVGAWKPDSNAHVCIYL